MTFRPDIDSRPDAPCALELMVEAHDSLFDEVLVGIVQLTGALSIELVVLNNDQGQCVARSGTRNDVETPTPRYRIRVPLVDGAAELWLYSIDPDFPDETANLAVIATMLARLVDERRAQPRSEPHPQWGYVVVRATGEIRVVSPRLCAAMGYEVDDVLGRNVLELVHPDDHAKAIDSLARTASFPGQKFPLDLRFVRGDETAILLEVTGEDRVDSSRDDIVFNVRSVDQRGSDDALVGDHLRVLDMIGRGEPLATTLNEIVRLASLRLGALCAVMMRNDQDLQLRVSASYGLSPLMLALLHDTAVGPQSNTCGVTTFRSQAVGTREITADESWRQEWPILTAEGIQSCWADPILSGQAGRALGALAIFTRRRWTPSAADVRIADVFASLASVAVQRAHAEIFLHHQATHDPLTGLPNRALFLELLESALTQRNNTSGNVAVLFVDLDRFKIVNDALGHEAGDDLLRAVTARLQLSTRSDAVVARFGGDEFTILAGGVQSHREAMELGERIVEAFRHPLRLVVGELVMTVSIGVVVSAQEYVSASALIRDADAAMYRAKSQGRNRVALYDLAMRADAIDRLQLVHALQEAARSDEFTMFYQPEICVATRTVVGAEALLRWRHPTRGLVPPADFIPLAEETGGILGLGDWTLAEACHQVKRWDQSGSPQIARVWVNVSAIQLLQPGFIRRVSGVLSSLEVPPDRIGLEITESALMTDIDSAIVVLADLRDLGLATAIDDFGTGQASLTYVRRLPVDLVKIDQSFVKDIVIDARGRAIVGAIVGLVHATGCRVLAEGIETEQQLVALHELGCDEAQGYWIGRPQPPETAPPLAFQSLHASQVPD